MKEGREGGRTLVLNFSRAIISVGGWSSGRISSRFLEVLRVSWIEGGDAKGEGEPGRRWLGRSSMRRGHRAAKSGTVLVTDGIRVYTGCMKVGLIDKQLAGTDGVPVVSLIRRKPKM